MTERKTTDSASSELLEPARIADEVVHSSRHAMSAAASASEYVVESMMAIALRQSVIGRRMIEDAFLGLQAISKAKSPQELLLMELTLLQQGSERIGEVVFDLSDTIRHSCFEAMGLALDLPQKSEPHPTVASPAKRRA